MDRGTATTEKLGGFQGRECSAVSTAVNRLRNERTKIAFHNWQVGGNLSQGSYRKVSGAED